MIRHIVMWNLKDYAEGADKSINLEKAKTLLLSCAQVVPGIRAFEVATATPGASTPERYICGCSTARSVRCTLHRRDRRWRCDRCAAAAAAPQMAQSVSYAAVYLAQREGLTVPEAEAVLAHLKPMDGHRPNTLLARQVLNRYATEKGIRFQDAEAVLRE
jgi:hypothetical protein